jgi:hypothetical protein
MKKHLSTTDFTIILVTIILFVVALFVKGFSKELLLEIGILLVSIKLILMNHKNAVANQRILEELNQVQKQLAQFDDKK